MRYLIITAMAEEAQAIEKQILCENILIIQSGIGKVNAAIATTKAILDYKPDHIINTGSAGALQEKLNIGDIIISNACYYHDVDVTAFGYQLGQIPKMPSYIAVHTPKNLTSKQHTIWYGPTVCGDQFVTAKQAHQILAHFPNALCIDMESCAIAHCANHFQIPCTIVRSISDKVFNVDNQNNFTDFLPIAAKNAAEMTQQLISIKNTKE